MMQFTTVAIFHGNCFIVHTTIFTLKKQDPKNTFEPLLVKYTLFLHFSAFSHLSSHLQEFKAL